jgi:hypothetical protein
MILFFSEKIDLACNFYFKPYYEIKNNRTMKKIILLFLTAFCFFSFSPATNFRTHYGEDYENALLFLQTNKRVFKTASENYGIEEKMLKAIVFPELLRYNMLQNLLETKALEMIYVNGGSNEVDFSIGNFQMKPSFAENLEMMAENNALWLEDFQSLCSYGNISDEKSIRKERLKRLSSLEWQVKYLSLFFTVAASKLEKGLTKSQQLRLIATLYNAGLHRTKAELEKLMNRPSFPFGYSVDSKDQHVYSDISLFFYQQ